MLTDDEIIRTAIREWSKSRQFLLLAREYQGSSKTQVAYLETGDEKTKQAVIRLARWAYEKGKGTEYDQGYNAGMAQEAKLWKAKIEQARASAYQEADEAFRQVFDKVEKHRKAHENREQRRINNGVPRGTTRLLWKQRKESKAKSTDACPGVSCNGDNTYENI